MSFERNCNGLRDGWFVFDSSLLLRMVLETWVLAVILLLLGATDVAGGSGLCTFQGFQLTDFDRHFHGRSLDCCRH